MIKAIIILMLLTATAQAGNPALLREVWARKAIMATAWDPSLISVSNRVSWIDPSDSAMYTLTSSNTFASISNKYGSAYGVAQSTGNLQPIKTNVSGSVSAVWFSGTTYLISSSSFTFVGTNITAVFVASAPEIANAIREISAFSYGGSDWAGPQSAIFAYFKNGTTNALGYRNSAEKSSMPFPLNNLNIVRSVYNGVNHTMYVNGVGGTPVSSSGTLAPNGGYSFGCGYNGVPAYPWKGVIAQGVYVTNISSNDALRLEGWAAWKYGIQSSLPTNHPYYGAAP